MRRMIACDFDLDDYDCLFTIYKYFKITFLHLHSTCLRMKRYILLCMSVCALLCNHV